jgi:type II secretory pathway pseudopilin PulG
MLIQVLIVTIVLAILAAIVILTVGTTTKGPRRLLAPATNAAYASCKSTVETIKAGLDAYQVQTPTGTYPATLKALTTKTATGNGPWLKSVPNTTATPSGLAKYGWAITTYSSTAGTFEVATVHGPPRPTGTQTVCKGA